MHREVDQTKDLSARRVCISRCLKSFLVYKCLILNTPDTLYVGKVVRIRGYLIYLLIAIRLTPGGSSAVHIYTETVDTTTQLILEECGPCPAFANYTLAFALQLRKSTEKPQSV
jgi:hypothetical protein